MKNRVRITQRYPGRKLTFGNQVWYWQIGKGNVVARNAETGEKKVVDLSRLTGVSWDNIERARHKHCTFSVLPGQVARWLTMGSETFTATKEETAQAMGYTKPLDDSTQLWYLSPDDNDT